jgi:hypothetical protein
VEKGLSISIPLDDDGFMRRECPTCERECKWRPTPDGEIGEPMPESGYACPYCAQRATADRWWTKAQAECVSARALSEIVGPALEGWERDPDPEALISFEVRVEKPAAPSPSPLPAEPNDMTRVDFECHPSEPVKIDSKWSGDVHCIICGTA